jgi:hypothetical protein
MRVAGFGDIKAFPALSAILLNSLPACHLVYKL